MTETNQEQRAKMWSDLCEAIGASPDRESTVDMLHQLCCAHGSSNYVPRKVQEQLRRLNYHPQFSLERWVDGVLSGDFAVPSNEQPEPAGPDSRSRAQRIAEDAAFRRLTDLGAR